MSDASVRVRVALPCTGLGRQQRGFERFTRELHEALRGASGLDLTVYGGGTLEADERAAWSLPRNSAAAAAVGRVLGRDPYFVEQISFFGGFLPHLLAWRPHLIYFADLNFGNACWHWRRVTGQRYRLLFYNGGATTMPYTRCDRVQQLTPEHFAAAVQRGEAPQRMFVLPHGARIPTALAPRDPARVAAVRRAFGAPAGRPLLLSVGLLDRSIKRMDALITAVAAMDAPRPFLALLGQETEETAAVRQLAHERLPDGCYVGTWAASRMPEAYEAADAFALLSLREGFGLAYVEALAAGLPIVAHETAGTRYVLGAHAWLGDTRDPAATVALLSAALLAPTDETARRTRHAAARDRFSWGVLAPQYAAMLREEAEGGTQRDMTP